MLIHPSVRPSIHPSIRPSIHPPTHPPSGWVGGWMLHTSEVIETTSKRTGVAKKKPKCVTDYNTHMHGVDIVDQYLVHYPLICKTVKWPKKVFFCLLQCCLFNSYVTFSKNNPNSHKSFLDFMSDITENLIHTSDAVSSLSSSEESQGSSRTPTPTPAKRAPKNEPPGRLDGKLKNYKLVHIPPTKNDKTPTQKCRVCARNTIKK